MIMTLGVFKAYCMKVPNSGWLIKMHVLVLYNMRDIEYFAELNELKRKGE